MRRSTHIRILPVLIAIVALGLLAGCGGGDGGGYSGANSGSGTPEALGPVSADQLNGRTFSSTTVTGYELVPDTTISLQFEPGVLSVSAGCNSFKGGYKIKDGTLTLGKAAGTLMGCESDRQEQDEWLTGMLSNGMEISAKGPELLLVSDDVSISLEEEAAAGQPEVVGTTWLLNSYTDKSGNAVSMNAGVRLPVLAFKANDMVDVFDGCNAGSGKAVVQENGVIDFGPIGLTRMACPGLTNKVSTAILSVIRGKAAYSFDAQNLVISRNGTSLTYTAGN